MSEYIETTRKSIPFSGDAKQMNANDSGHVVYADVINYQRSVCSGNHSCVMCGLARGTDGCVIRSQNKDVCTTCDSMTWFCTKLKLLFKFCKGNRSLRGR
jgi:hypothetical protein